MTLRQLLTLMICLLLGLSLQANARGERRQADVDIEVLDEDGRRLTQYPVRQKGRGLSTRAYLQARQGENYAVRVRNNTDYRVGLVIAVDGRNIVSGERSDLAPSERMYILNPYQSAVYEGWRTSRNRIHRFYFTEAEDSYAEAFDDRSAIGVIAVAAYREKARRVPKPGPHEQRSGRRQGPSSSLAEAEKGPGTGFGDSEWSPSVRVKFEPERRPITKHFIKYEWRKSLCRKGVIECRRPERAEPRNRFWPGDGNEGFAPYPPGYVHPMNRPERYWLYD